MPTPKSPNLPARRSVRLTAHDYAGPCWYHVTICAARRGKEFGFLAGGEVRLFPVGRLARDTWQALPGRIPRLRQDAFIVMPDHVHALVRIWPDQLGASSARCLPRRFGGSQAGALSLVINLFKGDVTREARWILGDPTRQIWQRGFHERIIRTNAQMTATRAYIINNPIRG